MKDLLAFLLKNILGSEDFSIEEVVTDQTIDLRVKSQPDLLGLIIGKEGRTIKNLRKILSIKGVLEKKSVSITIEKKD